MCPVCGNKTRLKIREDTELKKFPLYCPKCRQENLISLNLASSVFKKIRFAHVIRKGREVITMAIFHLSLSIAKRNGGERSLIAMAAYRSGERLYSELYEKHNYYNHMF